MGFMSSENCEEDQNTGLDIFQEILGRLNGKPEAQYGIAQQPSKDSKTATLPTRCWQLSHFVSGGFLAGKDSQEYLQETLPVSRSSSKKQFQATEHDALRTTRTPSKKDNASTDKSIILTYGKKRRRTGVSSNQTIIGGPLSQRLSPGRLIITNSLRNVDSITPAIVGIAVVDAHKTQHQLQMEDRKPGRKIKKAIERFPQPKPSQDFLASPAPSIYTDGPIIESPPVPNQPSPDLAQPLNGRHMARQRYITQKKMATKDSKALNEVSRICGKVSAVLHVKY